LWQGTAASVVDLNPLNYIESIAMGTDGVRQVGEIESATFPSNNHAAVWTGSANSVIDLNPASGYSTTEAYAVSGTQEVGAGYSNSFNTWTALLWNDTAASLVNLNPAGYSETYCRDTNGSIQVGFGYVPGGNSHTKALLWHGTAGSVENLGAMLPASLPTSQATSIDAAGNIFGVAQDTSFNWYAVEWAVPEPGAFSLIALSSVVLLARRSTKRLVFANFS
jgi:hypothetical protein